MQAKFIAIMLGTTAVAYAQPAPPPADPPPAAPPPAAPAEASWAFGIAPRVGLVVPTSELGAMVIGGLEVDYVVPAAQRRFVLALDLSLTRPSHDGVVMDPRLSAPGMYTLRETEIAIALAFEYRLGADKKLVPWIGVGPLLHVLTSRESTSIAPGDNTASSTELGLQVLGGVDYRVGTGFIFGDVRFAYSKLDHVLTGDSNAGKVTIAAGYRLVF